jgi:pyrimidine operon attenuation protein/uracil phosphoribosyltransferase
LVEFLSGIRQKAAVERTILTEGDIRRVLSRITHQILERHKSVRGLVLAGILTRGLPLARRLAGKIRDLEGVDVPVTGLDIRPYRDDGALSVEALPLQPRFSVEVDDRKIVVVDDVLYTGRSARCALDALVQAGRPRLVQLAILVDRGHRELPIRADYVGKNLPTSRAERVQVRLREIDGRDEVVLVRPQDG